MKFVPEEHSLGLLVGVEDVLDGCPEFMRCLIFAFHGQVKDIVSDRFEYLAPNAAISLGPCRIGGESNSAINVLHEAELAAHGFEERAPLCVVGVLQFPR